MLRPILVAALPALLILVSACSSGGDTSSDDADQLTELEAQLSDLQSENDDLRSQLEEAQATTTAATTTTESPTTTAMPTTTAAPTTTATPTTTLPPTTTTPAVPWTTEELDALLGPNLQAWAANPSSETYGPVIETAQLIAADANRDLAAMTLPEWADPAFGTAADAIAALVEADGDFRNVDRVRIALGHLGLPLYLPVAFPNGSYRVGTEEGMVPPGTYVAESDTGFDGCYWATLDAEGDIIDNNFLSSGFRVVARVPSGAFSVEFTRCGWFILQ
jgi:hypothetical protein